MIIFIYGSGGGFVGGGMFISEEKGKEFFSTLSQIISISTLEITFTI